MSLDDDTEEDGTVDMDGRAHLLLLEGEKDENHTDDGVVEDTVDNTGQKDDGDKEIHATVVDTVMEDGTTTAVSVVVGTPIPPFSLPLPLRKDVANRPTLTMVCSEYRSDLCHQRNVVEGKSRHHRHRRHWHQYC